jgi:predicted ATPase
VGADLESRVMPATDSVPLVEREVELSALAAAVEQAVGGEGQLVVVEGSAGIGKTRLLRAVRAEVSAREGARVLAARGTELESHVAFGVVRQLLDPLVFGLAEVERERLFVGEARLARAVLGEAEPDAGSPDADRYSKINGLFWLISSLARSGPLAVVVDDVQWADECSLEFLCFAARRVEGMAMLLVAASRPAHELPGHLSSALATDPGAIVLRPAPLSRHSVESLVRGSVGAAADADFASACLEATRGNPFLLSELLREVRARRLAPTAQEARRVGSLAPGGVSAVVELRLARMPEGAPRLAEAVAVLGDRRGAATAARLAGLEPSPAAEAEAALMRGGILEDRDGLCFTHPLVRSTVLHRISPTRRARLHAAAVAVLAERGAESEELAAHLLRVEPAGDPEVVETLRAAAARAGVRGAPATAAEYLERALRESPWAGSAAPCSSSWAVRRRGPGSAPRSIICARP